MKCSGCGAEVKEGAEFCVVCGKKLPKRKKCSKCGTEVLENVLFCTNCGNKFEQPVVEEYAYYAEEGTSTSSILKWVIAILVALLLGVGAFFYFYMMPQMSSSHFSVEISDSTQVVNNEIDNSANQEQQQPEVSDNQHAHVAATNTHSQLANKQADAVTPRNNGEWWKGTIGGKYGIRMYINEETGEFWYHYTKYNSNNRMYLTAIENEGNHLVLLETNKDGLDTGEFDGHIHGNTYSGTFYNYLNGKTFDFSLKRQ